MNRKTIMKSVVAIVGCLYICVILQTSVFSRIALAGITPNLLLVMTAMFGFMLGVKYGMVTGFLCGLTLDLFMGTHFGMYALIYLYIGLLNGLFLKIFYGDDIKLPLFLVAFSDLIYGMTIYGAFLFLDGERDFLYYFSNIIIPEIIYTSVVSLAFYYPLKSLAAWVDREEKRGTKTFA